MQRSSCCILTILLQQGFAVYIFNQFLFAIKEVSRNCAKISGIAKANVCLVDASHPLYMQTIFQFTCSMISGIPPLIQVNKVLI